MTLEPEQPTRRASRVWAILLAVVVCVGVGVAGVVALAGGEGNETDAVVIDDVETYSLAAAALEAAQASTVEFDMVVEAGSYGNVEMSGAVDNEAQLMTISMDMSSVMGAGEGSIEMILDAAGGVMYLSADGFGGMLPTDAEWISMDLAAMAEMTGQSLEDLQREFSFDPAATANLLLDEHDAVEIGDEEIDGEPVKHYRVTVDLAAVLAANPLAQQQLDDSGIDVGDVLAETVVYDVWVTADSQLRRLSFVLPVAGEELRTQLDLHSVGGRLDVELPAAGDVVDLGALMDL